MTPFVGYLDGGVSHILGMCTAGDLVVKLTHSPGATSKRSNRPVTPSPAGWENSSSPKSSSMKEEEEGGVW